MANLLCYYTVESKSELVGRNNVHIWTITLAEGMNCVNLPAKDSILQLLLLKKYDFGIKKHEGYYAITQRKQVNRT